MSITGSLETFSLPELFQIIESGKKSGRLSFKPSLKNNDSELKGTFEIWFKEGNFVTIIHSLKYQGLIAEIKDRHWADGRTVVETEDSCPESKELGFCFIEDSVLTPLQTDSLFEQQVHDTIKLFDVEFAWFRFEEANTHHIVSSDGKTFPWREMTGHQKRAVQLSLEAMRNFSNWQRFAEDMPLGDCGLQKLVNKHDLELNSLENYLWSVADGSISLKKIAQKQALDLETVQQSALLMILAGLIEEVPVTSPMSNTANISTTASRTAVAEKNSLGTKTKTTVNSQASQSLINNLVSFLRNNF